MLLEWQGKLRRAGVELELAFVSIDDDTRELKRFLDKNPSGVRVSYWLPDEEARSPFFKALGYSEEPTLPVHAFVAPNEEVACVVSGALEAGDFAAVKKLVTH
jgi:hypothetical protein